MKSKIGFQLSQQRVFTPFSLLVEGMVVSPRSFIFTNIFFAKLLYIYEKFFRKPQHEKNKFAEPVTVQKSPFCFPIELFEKQGSKFHSSRT